LKPVAVLIAVIVLGAAAFPAMSRAQKLAGDEEAGREIFSTECRACHGGMIAPALRGVMTRNIASSPDFTGYSDALKARAGQPWTEDAMDAFLKAPAEFAPGVRMAKATVDDKARADIIAYLKSLTPR